MLLSLTRMPHKKVLYSNWRVHDFKIFSLPLSFFLTKAQHEYQPLKVFEAHKCFGMSPPASCIMMTLLGRPNIPRSTVWNA